MLTVDNSYNISSSVAFTAAPKKSADELRKLLEKSAKAAKEAMKGKGSTQEKKEILNKVVQLAEETEKQASIEAKEKLNTKFGSKLDKTLDSIFTWVVTKFGKSDRLISKNKDTNDLIKSATRVVLLGNTLKEVVGTILYTTQAMTNEDLPQDKRKFVGLYDLCVGVVSTIVSLIFGIGLQNKITNGYSNLLKPAAKSLPRAAAFVVPAAAFTSFALQTIVGKRIIAPAIATPVAGRLKTKMMEKANAQPDNKS